MVPPTPFHYVPSLIFNEEHTDLVHHVAFDYYGRRLATASSDKTVCIWDRVNGKWLKSVSWKSHSGAVWKVIWAHPEFGQILATCSFDCSISIWEETSNSSQFHDVQAGCNSGWTTSNKFWRRCSQFFDSRYSVTDIKFSPRHLGLVLGSVSAQGIVRLYEAPDVMNLASWSLNHDFCAFKTRCSALTFSTNRFLSPLIAVATDDSEVTGSRVMIFEYSDTLRNWRSVLANTLLVDNPVSDVAFAPSAGRSYHTLAIASKNVSIYKIAGVNQRLIDMNDETYDSGSALVEYAIKSVEALEGGSQQKSDRVVDKENDVKRIAISSRLSDYEISLMETFGHPHHPAILIWRLSWNITGTALSGGSSDGVIRVWKCTFSNKWALVSVIKMSDNSKSDDEEQEMVAVTDLAQAVKHDKMMYY